jgi:DNA polymerase III alpha subunit
MARVKSINYLGKQQTYDLEIDHPDHQFYLANGCLTSNSHAVAYAIDSYQSAWLMTYYTAEWLCSYIETMVENPSKRAKALSELKSLGYKIKKLDINYATDRWTILSKRRFMPSFLTVKGIGTAAIDEVQRYRPYKSVHDLLWDEDGAWKHSKFNKRAFEGLIKIGAFDSMDLIGDGKMFSSYRQMHHIIIENMNDIKHPKRGRATFDRLLEETRDIEDWTKLEKVEFLEELIGDIDIGMFINDELMKLFEKKNVPSINSFNAEEDEKQSICWLVVANIEWKKTKNKKDYALLTVMGDDGRNFKVYCWGANKDKSTLKQYGIYLAELEKSDFGFATRAWKIKEIS